MVKSVSKVVDVCYPREKDGAVDGVFVKRGTYSFLGNQTKDPHEVVLVWSLIPFYFDLCANDNIFLTFTYLSKSLPNRTIKQCKPTSKDIYFCTEPARVFVWSRKWSRIRLSIFSFCELNKKENEQKEGMEIDTDLGLFDDSEKEGKEKEKEKGTKEKELKIETGWEIELWGEKVHPGIKYDDFYVIFAGDSVLVQFMSPRYNASHANISSFKKTYLIDVLKVTSAWEARMIESHETTYVTYCLIDAATGKIQPFPKDVYGQEMRVIPFVSTFLGGEPRFDKRAQDEADMKKLKELEKISVLRTQFGPLLKNLLGMYEGKEKEKEKEKEKKERNTILPYLKKGVAECAVFFETLNVSSGMYPLSVVDFETGCIIKPRAGSNLELLAVAPSGRFILARSVHDYALWNEWLLIDTTTGSVLFDFSCFNRGDSLSFGSVIKTSTEHEKVCVDFEQEVVTYNSTHYNNTNNNTNNGQGGADYDGENSKENDIFRFRFSANEDALYIWRKHAVWDFPLPKALHLDRVLKDQIAAFCYEQEVASGEMEPVFDYIQERLAFGRRRAEQDRKDRNDGQDGKDGNDNLDEQGEIKNNKNVEKTVFSGEDDKKKIRDVSVRHVMDVLIPFLLF